MSDLIDRQMVIDALMTILDKPNHAEFLYTDEICKALNELPSAQPEPKWIPCEKKLPEKDGRYMVTFRDNVYFSPFEDGEWYIVGVTAWKEIPEPYREEADNAQLD